MSALFALAAPDSRPAFVYLAYIPAFVFWGLDGFFLWQEGLYRALYDHVRRLTDEEIDFSMDTAIFQTNTGPTWAAATFSKTVFLFHGVLVFAIVVVMFLSLSTAR